LNTNDIFKLARNGDKEAEKLLFIKLRERFSFITQQRVEDNQDIEDIVQDSLMVIARKYIDIDFLSSFSAWARQVLENNILNFHRTRARRGRKMIKFLEQEKLKIQDMPNPEIKRRLLDCLKKLNESNIRHARILNFVHQGFKIEQICKKLNISKNATYVLLSRARDALRICMKNGIKKNEM
jgi:RNA polymerase sigma factor (sigma-70 family)